MMIKIQINLSLPPDGSFVAHSMIMTIQKTVPASAKATKVNKNSNSIKGHSLLESFGVYRSNALFAWSAL